MVKQVVQIGLEKELLDDVDKYIKDIGMGANRSGFLSEAVKIYLGVKRGDYEISTKS